jgi:hypothetical protein
MFEVQVTGHIRAYILRKNGGTMKDKKEIKLRLTKVTILDFETCLGRDELKAVKGGDDDSQKTTVAPVICQP